MRPINVYVIEHPDGVVVFDTGQDRESVTDPCYFPGGSVGLIYRRLAKFHITENATLTAGLERLGYDTSDVTTAAISHLHQDHIGGISEIGQAQLLVSAPEWASLHRPLAGARGFLRTHIELPGLTWNLVDFADLGRVVASVLAELRPVRRRFVDDSPDPRAHARLDVDAGAPRTVPRCSSSVT